MIKEKHDMNQVPSTLRLLTLCTLTCLLTTFPAMASPSGVTFHDVATDGGLGLDYERTRSQNAVIWDGFRQLEFFSFLQLIDTPHKWRGVPGVVIFDYDGDGDQDVFVTNGPGSDNSLFENQLQETGALGFLDVAVPAGVAAADHDGSGACAGDTDNDGDRDLLILSPWEPSRFFENNGDGTFTDVSAVAGLSNDSLTSMSCSFGDVDGDGLLDVVVGNAYQDMSSLLGIAGEPFAFNVPNQLFRNTGGNVFTDVSASSGILDLRGLGPFDGSATITWAIAMVDYDLDGDVDIIQADDQAGIPRSTIGGIDRGIIHILENDGTGQFTDVTVERGTNKTGEWMGLSFGDLNGDGYLDLFGSNVGDYATTNVTDLDPVYGNIGFPYALGDSSSRWFLGSADKSFSDPGVGGLVATPFGWGTSMADYDADGDTDVIYHGGMAIGPVVHADNLGVMLSNDGAGNLSYDADALAQSTNHQRRNVLGMAVGDLDDDGFTDIVSASNFDIQDAIPLVTYNVMWGSPFDGLGAFQATFLPTETPGLTVFSGIEDNVNGTLSVEINNAENGNRWAKVSTLGTVGLTTGGAANRDGIGAVVSVRTARGKSTMRPVTGGSSFASQDSHQLASASAGPPSPESMFSGPAASATASTECAKERG